MHRRASTGGSGSSRARGSRPASTRTSFRVFNTNTAHPRPRRARPRLRPHVALRAEGRSAAATAVQLERLYHEIAWELDATFLEVPRTGPRGRFFPIKKPEDLARAQPGLREMLGCIRPRLSSRRGARPAPGALRDATDRRVALASARALQSAADTYAARSRHGHVTRRSVRSRDGAARARAPLPMRGMWRPGSAALRAHAPGR